MLSQLAPHVLLEMSGDNGRAESTRQVYMLFQTIDRFGNTLFERDATHTLNYNWHEHDVRYEFINNKTN